jgi:hypothetical protein
VKTHCLRDARKNIIISLTYSCDDVFSLFCAGTSGVSAFLNKAADGLVAGGQEEVPFILSFILFSLP